MWAEITKWLSNLASFLGGFLLAMRAQKARENELNRKILQENERASRMSDAELADRLSKLSSKGRVTVRPRRRGD